MKKHSHSYLKAHRIHINDVGMVITFFFVRLVQIKKTRRQQKKIKKGGIRKKEVKRR